MKKYLSTKNIARIAVLGAVGAFLMIMDFPITFIAPSFYKLDLSDLPCLIGSFAMGPIPCVFIEIIKILIKLLIKPTSTAFVGEVTAFLGSIALCVPAGLFYKANRTKNGAIKALILSSIIYILVAIIINYSFSIPFYGNLYHIGEEAIIAMGSDIFSIIKDKLGFVLVCVGPFNLIKVVIIDVLTIVLYKRISPLLRDF